MFIEIKPEWKDETVIIIGSGSSVTAKDLELVRQLREENLCKVIAINANYAYAEYADVVYFCDYKFYNWHKDKREFQNHTGRKISICPHDIQGVERLKQGAEHGLSRKKDTLNTGRNSGFQCINLAYLMGASDIILLGYDMKVGSAGQTHHHPEHPQPTDPTVYGRILADDPFPRLAVELDDEFVTVFNCSMDSAINCFSKATLEAIVFNA